MRYNVAPIREAIFDIKVNELASGTIDRLEKVCQKISENYPNKKKQYNISGRIQFKENLPLGNETSTEFIGFILSNVEGNRQVQIRIDGFSFNMLKPYSEWEDFSSEAFRLWKVYTEILNPDGVNRIALRYINKIDIPLPMENFQKYIVNMPPIPLILPQKFKNFFMQIEVPCEKEDVNVILTETIDKASSKVLPFILDIDVYKLKKADYTEADLRVEFEYLRSLKNNIFENCITQEAKKLFN